MASDFTLDDFARQLQQLRQVVRRPDTLSHVLDYFRENQQATTARLERIIAAMSSQERQDPDQLGSSDRQRIASACGLQPQDIEQFLKQFGKLREEMRQMASLGFWQRLLVLLGRRRLPQAGEG